jgi:GAF domain-containing protein
MEGDAMTTTATASEPTHPETPALPARARRTRSRTTRAERRFRALADVSHRLATFTDVGEVFAYAARRARAACGAGSCAVLVADGKRGDVGFTAVSQSTSGLAETRVPVDQGVAGWVLAHDEALLVPDTAADARSCRGVDRRAGGSGRAVVCAPLRTRWGNVGVLEVVDPIRGHFDDGDLKLVEAFAAGLGAAWEKATLYDALPRRSPALPHLLRLGGAGLSVLGLLLVGTVLFCQLAQAVPLGEFWRRPGATFALATLVLGGLVTALGARDPSRRRARRGRRVDSPAASA